MGVPATSENRWPFQSLLHLFLILFPILLSTINLVQLTSGAALQSSMVLPGSPACDANNRDPCTTFPGLCSTGGGLCVLKGPCEYECVCPPDGRRGRDCTGNGDVINPPLEESREPSSGSSLLNSLLVFPQDLFWDLNHVLRPEESVKMMLSTPPNQLQSGPSTTVSTPSISSNSTEKELTSITTATPQILFNENTKPDNTGVNNTPPPAPIQRGEILQHQTRLDISYVKGPASPQTTEPTTRKETTTGLRTSSAMPLEQTHSPTASPVTSQLFINDEGKDRLFINTGSRINVFDDGSVRGDHDADDNQSKSSVITDELNSSPTGVRKAGAVVMARPTTQITSSSQTSSASTTAPLISTSKNVLNIHQQVSDFHNPTSTSTHASNYDVTTPITTPKQISLADLLRLMDTATRSTPLTSSVGLREVFPGHENFPTFFRDVVEDKDKEEGPPNAALSKRVHRVFYPISQFQKIQRRRNG